MTQNVELMFCLCFDFVIMLMGYYHENESIYMCF